LIIITGFETNFASCQNNFLSVTNFYFHAGILSKGFGIYLVLIAWHPRKMLQAAVTEINQAKLPINKS